VQANGSDEFLAVANQNARRGRGMKLESRIHPATDFQNTTLLQDNKQDADSPNLGLPHPSIKGKCAMVIS
jgi:hypothetical protein